MSKLTFDAEIIRQAAGIELAQHEQAWRGWLWRIDGLADWDGLYDTQAAAVAAALRSLLARARAHQVEEAAALDGPNEEFAAYQRIKQQGKSRLANSCTLVRESEMLVHPSC